MNKADLVRIWTDVKNGTSKNAPAILTGVGITLFAGAVVLAVVETPKALEKIEAKKREEQKEKLTVKETVQATWKNYIPVATTAVLATTCLIGAHSVSARRNAALMTAYKLSETTVSQYREHFARYRDKVVETIGETAEKEVREKIEEEREKKALPADKPQVVIYGDGDIDCYDYHSGRWFKSTKNKVDAAINTLNKRMMSEMYISLNELYSELGLEPTGEGDMLGWCIDDGFIEVSFDPEFTSDYKLYMMLNYLTPPKYDFNKLY